MADTKSMLIMCDDYEMYDQLSDEDAGKVFKALMHKYGAGEDPEEGAMSAFASFAFSVLSKQIDRSSKKYKVKAEAGKAGGEKSGEVRSKREAETKQNEANTKQSEADVKQSKASAKQNELPNPNPIPIPNPISPSEILDISADAQPAPKPAKPVRHKYGQYQNVLLSDDQMAKLREECPTDWQERIERLSEYMASKGASYKDHLATIRAWKRKEGQSPPIRPQTGQAGQRPKNAFLAYNQRETDYDALERELAKMGGV